MRISRPSLRRESKTVRFLLPWMLIEQSRGQRDWTATDKLVGGLASRGIRPFPFALGSPSWTRSGGFCAASAEEGAARQTLGGLPEGGGGPLRPAAEAIGPTGIRQQFGQDAVPFPITAWQIWNEPNPRQQFDPGGTVEHAAQLYAKLLRISHDSITSEDPHATIVHRRIHHPEGSERLRLARELLLGARNQGRLRRGRPARVRAQRRQGQHLDQGGSQGDGEARRSGYAALDHGDRLGVGAPGRRGHQPGPGRPSEHAHPLLQSAPESPKHLEHSAHLLVRLARSGRGLELCESALAAAAPAF